MLRFALLLSILALPCRAEEGDEDSGSAIKAYGRAVKNMNKSGGYHIDTKIDVDMGGSSMPGGSVEGVIKNPDLGHFKVDIAGNALDLFKEGERVALLNPQTGKWEAQAGNPTLDFFIRIFNLGTLLGDLREGAEKAEFGEAEELGKRECRTVEFGVPKKTLEKLIKGDGKGSLGVSPENAKMKVKTWIDKKEQLPRKITIVIDVELKGLPGADDKGEDWEDWEDGKGGAKKDGKKDEPKADGENGKKHVKGDGDDEIPPMKIAITVTATIKKYGQELEIEVPEAAQKVLDAQKKNEETGPKKDGPGDPK